MANTYKFKNKFRQKYLRNGNTYSYDKAKGDIIEGNPRIIQGQEYVSVDWSINNRPIMVRIPMNYLSPISMIAESKSSFEGSEENTSSKFTLKNILIGVVGIVVVYGILKATKIIK
jgi:hypothetical protein